MKTSNRVKTLIRVTAAIIRRDGLILLARRNDLGHLAGLWEFPGGKIEPGETPEQCLRRELLEEFELEAAVGAFVCASQYDYGNKQIELLAYETRLERGEPALNSHEEVAWVPIAELLEYELAPADVPIAKKLVEAAIGTS